MNVENFMLKNPVSTYTLDLYMKVSILNVISVPTKQQHKETLEHTH